MAVESNHNVAAQIDDDETKAREAVIRAAKRLIRASLHTEDISRVDNADAEEFREGLNDLVSAANTLVDDLTMVLGPSFEKDEIESMVRDVRKEWNAAEKQSIPQEKDNTTTSNSNSPSASATAAGTSIHGECMASPLPTPSTATRSAAAEEGIKHADASRMTADRHALGLLETVRDADCLEREFDVEDDAFDVEEAIDVLVRCRILVLRNLFSKKTTERVFPRYSQYISDVQAGRISREGTTTFGGDYFILKEDDSRFNYMATKELVEASTGLLDREILVEILSDPFVLGDSFIVNHVGTIDAKPGADAQYWHADGVYTPNENAPELGFVGVGGHDLPPFAINLFTPLLPHAMGPEHGPTEFCVGTSHLKGHDTEEDLPVENETLLAADGDIVERLQEFEWHIERGWEPPSRADCPEHLHRIPLLQKGDAILFDYMLTHRGGANNSPDHRSMIFATYSRKWFRDTNFDTDFGHREYLTPLDELTRLTRFAVVEEATGE